MRRAAVLAGEHAEEIAEPALLQPLHGADHDMVAFTAENAPGHQDHFRIWRDAPRFPDRIDAGGRHAVWVETAEIDAAGHHRKFAPRRAIAVVHEMRELFAGD